MKKNGIIILIIIALTLGLVAMLYSVLAKYKESADASATAEVANWNIKVNDELIANKTQLVNSITPVFDSSEYVNNDVVAPGVTGYYDIAIDASDTDVTFTYSITNEAASDSLVKDLIVTDYQINDGEKISCDGNISGEITHNTAQTKIRVFIKWDDTEEASMNNEEDTVAGTSGQSAKLLVKMNFIQKK